MSRRVLSTTTTEDRTAALGSLSALGTKSKSYSVLQVDELGAMGWHDKVYLFQITLSFDFQGSVSFKEHGGRLEDHVT